MKNQSCQNCSKTFKILPEDIEYYKKMQVPEPTFCPDCRQQRRLSWCNEMVLYNHACALCKKKLLSIYSPTSPITPYCRDCWWSDKWDGNEYGREIDWEKSISSQWAELANKVPRIAVNTSGRLENCDYVHYCGDSKNCYLTFHADLNENCFYAYGLKKSKDCMDAYNNFDCELCYECIDCHDCFNIKWCQDSLNCYDSFFLKDCQGCSNCCGCVGLRNQKYHFFNKQLSQEEYEEKIKNLNLSSRQEIEKIIKKVRIFQESKFYKYIQGHKNENSTGNNLYNNNSLKDSFDCDDVEKGKYCYQLYMGAKDCYDYYQFGMDSELIYDSTIIGVNSFNIKFCHYCVDKCQNLEYCHECASGKNCFACVSLKKKEFCILNKQYSEKEYFQTIEKLKAKMKKDGEYGGYLASIHSPFGYNETSANWWFPLKKEEALAKKSKWQDNLPETKGQGILEEAPDDIGEVDENILKQVLTCSHCQRNYKIIVQELEYYKKQKLPLPDICFNCRHLRRQSQRNPRCLWHRQCDCTQPEHGHQGRCQNEFETTYSPERKELVYCEECYKKEIY